MMLGSILPDDLMTALSLEFPLSEHHKLCLLKDGFDQ
jgi:hypothetical protein